MKVITVKLKIDDDVSLLTALDTVQTSIRYNRGNEFGTVHTIEPTELDPREDGTFPQVSYIVSEEF